MKKKIFVFGGAMMRNLTQKKCFVDKYEVVDSIINYSPISLMSSSADFETEELEVKNNFENRIINSGAEYLLIDLLTLTFELMIGKDSIYTQCAITDYSKFIDYTRFVPIRCAEGVDSYLNEFQRFMGILSNHFPSNKIILVNASLALFYIHNGVLKAHQDINMKYKLFYEKYDEMFVNTLKCNYISKSYGYFGVKYNGYPLSSGIFQEQYYLDIVTSINEITNNRNESVVIDKEADFNFIMNNIYEFEDSVYIDRIKKIYMTDKYHHKVGLSLSKRFYKKYNMEFKEINKHNPKNDIEYLEIAKMVSNVPDFIETLEAVLNVLNLEFERKDIKYEKIFEYKLGVINLFIDYLCKQFSKYDGCFNRKKMTIYNCENYYKVYKSIGSNVDMIDMVNNAILVDVWGSCVSRNSLAPLMKEGVVVDKYLFHIDPIFACERRATDPVLKDWKSIPFEDRCSMYQKYNYAFESLNESKSTWLVLDLFTVLDGSYTVFEDHIIYDASIKKESSEKIYQMDFNDIITRFTGFMKKMHDKYGNKIIVVDSYFSEYFFDENDLICEFDKNLSEYEPKQADFYNRFRRWILSNFNIYFIGITTDFISSETDTALNKRPIHYEADFYKETSKIIKLIISSEPEKKHYYDYSYKTRVERIIRFKKHKENEKYLGRFFNKYGFDSFVCDMDSEFIRKYRDNILMIYNCGLKTIDEIEYIYDFRECPELKDKIKKWKDNKYTLI